MNSASPSELGEEAKMVEQLITDIIDQEKRLVFSAFRSEDAWELGRLTVQVALERELGVTIDVMRGEQQMFHCALPGTSADNDQWISRKTRVVRRFGHSSLLIRLQHDVSGVSFEDQPWNAPKTHAAFGGSFPINLPGSGMIGTLTVSGLPDADDHALVVDVIERFLGGERPSVACKWPGPS